MSRHRDQVPWRIRPGSGTTGPASNANTQPLVVYNGLSWERTDVVRLKLPADENESVTAIRTPTGGPVAFDIDDEGNAVFVAKNVPSMGYATYEMTTAAGQTCKHLETCCRDSIRRQSTIFRRR